MATKPPRTYVTNSSYARVNGEYIANAHAKTWTNHFTLLPDGKPDVTAENQHERDSLSLLRCTDTASPQGVYHAWSYANNDVSGLVPDHQSRCDSVAYARFRSQLYSGSANLGVTLGELGQTLNMIHGRTLGLAQALDRANTRILNNRDLLRSIQDRGVLARDVLATWSHDGREISTTIGRRIVGSRVSALRGPGFTLPENAGRFAVGSANALLEYKFGWTPLFRDIHALFSTVIPKNYNTSRIQARAKLWDAGNYVDPSPYVRLNRTWVFYNRTTYTAQVQVENPNLWLANRAGLINLPAVAWDLIPWSWVVGMFGNFSQMLNSMTDFYGLSITRQSVVRQRRGILVRDITDGPYAFPPSKGARLTQSWRFDRKRRVIDVALRPAFTVKVPELNLDLALTATALAVQRMGKLSRLLNPFT